MKIGEQLFGAGLGMVTGGVGSLIQGAQQKKFLGLQAKYNEEMAQKNHERNKDMWDYTNYENQMKHIVNSGLSPGLMYGQSGGGGVSASGGSGQGVGLADAKSGDIMTKSMGMGLQAAQLQSAIEVNKSQAEKNKADASLAEAEAAKKSGIDTEVGKATIENLIAQTTNEKAKEELIYADRRLKDAEAVLSQANTSLAEGKTEEITWSIKMLESSINKMKTEIEGTSLDNELKSRTMNARVMQATKQVEEIIANILVKGSDYRLNESKAIEIAESIKQKWEMVAKGHEEIAVSREKIALDAEKMLNDMEIAQAGLKAEYMKALGSGVTGIGMIMLGSKIGTKGHTTVSGFGGK